MQPYRVFPENAHEDRLHLMYFGNRFVPTPMSPLIRCLCCFMLAVAISKLCVCVYSDEFVFPMHCIVRACFTTTNTIPAVVPPRSICTAQHLLSLQLLLCTSHVLQFSLHLFGYQNRKTINEAKSNWDFG